MPPHNESHVHLGLDYLDIHVNFHQFFPALSLFLCAMLLLVTTELTLYGVLDYLELC